MTTLEKIVRAAVAEFARHQGFLDSPSSGVRSIQLTLKLTPKGEIRAVFTSFETEAAVEDPSSAPYPQVAAARPATMGSVAARK